MPALAVELTDEQHEMIKQEAARSGRSQKAVLAEEAIESIWNKRVARLSADIAKKSEKLNELLE